MVGLQLRREVLKALPNTLRKLVGVDTLMSAVVFGGAAIGLLSWCWRGRSNAPVVEGTIVLIAAAVGWAMETRSLRGEGAAEERLAVLVRAGGSLASVVAIVVFAIGIMHANHPIALGGRAWPALVIAPAMCAALAVFMGVAGRYMLTLAGKQTEYQLAVFIGVVAFVAGIATELETPSLFAALLTGAVMANLKGVDLRRFERFILGAEHALAVIFAIVAGVLLDPVIGWGGLIAALSLVALRLIGKPMMMRGALRSQRARHDPPGKGELPARSRLYAGAARQSPIATVMLVSLVLAHPTEASQELLTIVALTGLLCEVLTIARRTPAPKATAPETAANAAAPEQEGAAS